MMDEKTQKLHSKVFVIDQALSNYGNLSRDLGAAKSKKEKDAIYNKIKDQLALVQTLIDEYGMMNYEKGHDDGWDDALGALL